MTRGALIATLSGLQLRLHFEMYVASICIKSVHVFFGNVRILFVGDPWLDVV